MYFQVHSHLIELGVEGPKVTSQYAKENKGDKKIPINLPWY
jgi:hypothetical protein